MKNQEDTTDLFKLLASFGNLQSPSNIRKDDVFVVSYPRSGNTWLRMIITHIVSGGRPMGLADMDACVPDIYKSSSTRLEEIQSPRILKSHSAATTAYPSVIYCLRDPRAVCVSYYNYQIRIGAIERTESIGLFVDRFLSSKLFPFATWEAHVLGWCESHAPQDSRWLFIRYEDIALFPGDIIRKIADFLKTPLDEGGINDVTKLTSFERLHLLERGDHEWQEIDRIVNPEVPFFRKGSTTSWKDVQDLAALSKIEEAYFESMKTFGYSLIFT